MLRYLSLYSMLPRLNMQDDVTIYDLKCVIAVAQEGSGSRAANPKIAKNVIP
ncbi:MAG TPA: hypothetical protein VHX63_01005 [Acidobacteriaceae bacterium]|jgi:hypothetical protein|nr:hypothetical protein [Acidobacteriaceae bacterium]